MEVRSGKKIFNGIAIGPVRIYKKVNHRIVRTAIVDIEGEIKRYEMARRRAIEQLNALHEKAVADVGEESAEIFNVHAMMLDDDNYNDSVREIIRSEGVNAEYATDLTGRNFAKVFSEMGDEYFKARSADVLDVTNRVVGILCGGGDSGDIGDVPAIVVAEDFAPSETVRMDKSKLLSLVTRLGSTNSHTAILARTMGIPALIGVEIDESWDGKTAIVDAYEGKIIVDPDGDTLAEYEKKKAEDDEKKKALQALKGKENVTKSGRKIHLYANIGSPRDLDTALENDAGGIGLFRSEFLYLGAKDYPTEEEQFQAYKAVLEGMKGKKVIIRTLDIGADKQVDYFKLDKEENPALGYRAIRICLTRPEIFRTQLRALYRASAYGNLAIMYPMIISVDEVRQVKAFSKKVREELAAEGVQAGAVEEGIMIETPAAAIMSDELAKGVDFFSIGTNDLTQYTLAIDRQNPRLDPFYNPHHPAVLRLIQMVADNAHKAGIWCGLCGELGADTALTETFLKMGLDELSVSPGSILPIRQQIRETE